MNIHKDNYGTVLYVDQEETAGKYIRESLSGSYQLIFANSAHQALSYLCDRSLHIDVVVSDDKFPDRASDGILRHAIEIHPYIQCILLTADSLPDAVHDQIGRARGWRVLEKPIIDMAMLNKAIEDAIERSLRQQIRCHRFEAAGDMLHFLGEQIAAQNTAVQRLHEHVSELGDQGIADARAIREQTALITSGMRRLQGDLLQSLRHALNEIGYARFDETNVTAGRMIWETLTMMSLTPAERDIITVVVKQDFPIPRTASLMDLVLSNILRVAIASAQRAADKPWVTIIVQVQGAPEIVISDGGDGVPDNVKRELTDTMRTEPLSPSAQILKTCLAIMRFMGGTVLLTSFPLRTSQITLEFPRADDGMDAPGTWSRATELSSWKDA